MAEANDSPESAPEAQVASQNRWGRSARSETQKPPRPRRSTKLERRAAREERTTAVRAGRRGPVRSILTLAVVTGLVATVAIPAYAAWQPEAEATTLQQLAADGAQTLVVASDVSDSTLARGSYSATTPDEISKKKAEEAAAAAAAARVQAAAARSSSSGSYAVPAGVPLVAPGSGLVRRPLPYFNNFGAPYAGHRGTDYMVERGTPIYSVADGVVTASSDGGGGLGVTITIMHNINGHAVQSVYGHMLPGSRTVGAGATVSAGQMIGQVSDTGLAFGTHLHLMIHVDGTRVDAEGWLAANAG
ncbi:MAG: M23 family metallopeptidase [Microbacterium sp.]|uniref:M23 family metallopeptidase n=1 Tax=Microbacterium sp. TaxID=51671 RepID=UPI002716152D|nr:M23 family metallopeptidase [Microbacterium sp.]MDO8382617.1 M23 family metallopeptidase [Microbacterium sp.]